MKPIQLLWGLLWLVSACKSDKVQPIPATLERIELRAGDRVQEEVVWNRQANRVDIRLYETALVDSSGKPPLLARNTYFFNAQNQLSSSEHEGYYTICGFCSTPIPPSKHPTSSYTMTYQYQNGVLTQAERQEVRNNQTVVVGKQVFHTDSKGQIGRVEQWYGFSGPLALFETLTFRYDSKGNLQQRETFAANGFRQEVLTFQYDNKPNPFRTLGLIDFEPRYLSPHNVVYRHRRIFEDADPPGTVRQNEQTIRYTYHASGWPVTMDDGNRLLRISYD
ncbi:hypothetical protein ACFQ4C_24035 [Larkinella insperata]|uniref:YD repeat-containing protein n=1 Tax=Larkinella insperata TaxID=332158 RepID=A0ABW3QEK3_9BACT|nr:hypothetical protein [Larkinella insperata]